MTDTIRDVLAEQFVASLKGRFPMFSDGTARELALSFLDSIEPASLELLNTSHQRGRAEDYDAAQAGTTDPLARRLIGQMRDQLLIALIVRAGGEIKVPVKEIDATGGYFMTMRVDGRAFIFTVEKRS